MPFGKRWMAWLVSGAMHTHAWKGRAICAAW
jgi:hypothetical protein